MDVGPVPSAAHPLARKEGLYRPVGGPIVGRFGAFRDHESGVVLSRDGVELRARPNEPVRAVASGVVAEVQNLPGLGLAVIVDHGDGWLSLIAHLAAPLVQRGDNVHAGQHLADAAGKTVHLQIAEGGALLDPTAWLAR